MEKDSYLQFLSDNSKKTLEYYAKTYIKTEQQKKLEEVLMQKEDITGECLVGDFGCGGGSLSFYLNQKYPQAKFELMDFNKDAVALAQSHFEGLKNFHVTQGNLEELHYKDNTFDYVFLWQTLSWLTNPEKVLQEIKRVLKPGGIVYISALVNYDHDVDLLTQVFDHTRDSGNVGVFYNTYSKRTINKWLGLDEVEYLKFVPENHFYYEGKGLGSFTIDSEKGKLQVSAGMLMNWSFIRAKK